MTQPQLNVGIAFNAFEPVSGRPAEQLSEESVADVAAEVNASVRKIGYAVSVIPLQRSFVQFIRRVKELNVDVLVNLCEGFYGRPQWESNVAATFELMHLTFTGNNSRTLTVCQDKHRYEVLVAEVDGKVAGFVAYEVREKEGAGEVVLVAVHPDYQNRDVGTQLNEGALQALRAAGMRLAVVETGGDASHAPARRSYEKAGYTALPLVRYYKAL